MQLDKATLLDELMQLWKGPAAHDTARLARLGPQLRHVCGVTEQDTPNQVKVKLRTAIELLLGDRPPDLITYLQAGLALHPEARHQTPGKRLDWAAGQIDRSRRTAMRKAELARETFAELAAATTREATTDPGVVLTSFRGRLDLTGELPRFVERREGRVTAERLSAIPAAFGIAEPSPGYEPGFDITVTSGGTGSCGVQRTGGTVTYQVGISHPLECGQGFGVEVEFLLPDWGLLLPYYGLAPRTMIHLAEISVIFNPLRLPDRVWHVDHVLPGQINQFPPDCLVLPDPSGQVQRSLRALEQGWSYGIAWSWEFPVADTNR